MIREIRLPARYALVLEARLDRAIRDLLHEIARGNQLPDFALEAGQDGKELVIRLSVEPAKSLCGWTRPNRLAAAQE